MTQEIKKKKSSIALDEATRIALGRKRIHERETYEQILKRLVLDVDEKKE